MADVGLCVSTKENKKKNQNYHVKQPLWPSEYRILSLRGALECNIKFLSVFHAVQSRVDFRIYEVHVNAEAAHLLMHKPSENYF